MYYTVVGLVVNSEDVACIRRAGVNPFRHVFSRIQSFRTAARRREIGVFVDQDFSSLRSSKERGPHPGPLPAGEGEVLSFRAQREILVLRDARFLLAVIVEGERGPSPRPSPGGRGGSSVISSAARNLGFERCKISPRFARRNDGTKALSRLRERVWVRAKQRFPRKVWVRAIAHRNDKDSSLCSPCLCGYSPLPPIQQHLDRVKYPHP